MPARPQGSGSWPRRAARARMQASTDRQCLTRFLFLRCCLSRSNASSRVIGILLPGIKDSTFSRRDYQSPRRGLPLLDGFEHYESSPAIAGSGDFLPQDIRRGAEQGLPGVFELHTDALNGIDKLPGGGRVEKAPRTGAHAEMPAPGAVPVDETRDERPAAPKDPRRLLEKTPDVIDELED